MNLSWVSLCLVGFGGAFLGAYLLTPVMERLAPRLSLMDLPDPRRIHTRPTPRAGGIAVFLGFHAGCALIFLIPHPVMFGDLSRDWWLRFLAVSALLLAVGIADDTLRLRPLAKLGGQTAAALLAYALDFRFGVMLRMPVPGLVDLALTLAWLLTFINIFNLIDGIDGLATGLALVASVGLMLSLVLRRQPSDAIVTLALAGAGLAFLRYNFHPARIFLGDSGSMFLGLTLAVLALSTASKSAVLSSLLVPLLAVGVPLFDTLLAIWRRSVRQILGRSGHDKNGAGVSSILMGDTDHLHHRLQREGMSQRRVAVLLFLLSGALVVVGLLLMTFHYYVVGISLAAFVAGVYVMVRHLAHVELWDTGTAVLRGLRRPPRRVLCVLLYPLVDVLIMGGALAATIFIFADTPPGQFVGRLLKYSVVWISVPFLVLILSGSYHRVWSRAGAAEFAMFLTALAGGLLLAAGLANVLLHFSARELLKYLPVYGGITLVILTGLRGCRPVILDLMAYRWRRHTAPHPPRRLLLYGADDCAMLFLREQGYAALDNQVAEQVLGLLDDDSNLHGRMIHGCRVLGGLEYFLQHAAALAVDEVILTQEMQPDNLTRLKEAALRQGIALSAWHTERRRIIPEPTHA